MCPEMGGFGAVEVAALIATHATDFGLHTKGVIKAADEIVNNSNVLQDDDELLFAVGANEIWLGLIIFLVVSATTTPDMDLAFTVPAGGAITGIDQGLGWNSMRDIIDLTGEQTKLALTNSTKQGYFWFIYVGGAAAGNVQFKWAQNVATAEDTKVLKDSCIIAHKLA